MEAWDENDNGTRRKEMIWLHMIESSKMRELKKFN